MCGLKSEDVERARLDEGRGQLLVSSVANSPTFKRETNGAVCFLPPNQWLFL